MPISYEKERLANIARNNELLKELGLDKPMFEPVEKKRKKAPVNKKRKASTPPSDETEESSEPAAKAPRVESSIRRSSRNTGKVVDYNAERKLESPMPIAFKAGIRTTDHEGPLGRESGKRIHNPKTYGFIPGIEVGTWWELRAGCNVDAIHAPVVAGIHGGPQGAYSIALSGGYEDDVDLGYAFTYTGSGGRDLKGTKANPKNLRTAPQSSDQTFDNPSNAALKKSAETGKPVRVIRGFKGCKNSPYAPSEGYRYDGLYRVEKAWMEPGLNPQRFLVCKFALKRLPGQPPIPKRDDEETPTEETNGSDSDAEEGAA